MPSRSAYSDGADVSIRPDGLRYESKPTGFVHFGFMSSGSVMSCFKCGVHKPRTLGKVRRILGANQFFCAECNQKKEDAIAARLAAEKSEEAQEAGSEGK